MTCGFCLSASPTASLSVSFNGAVSCARQVQANARESGTPRFIHVLNMLVLAFGWCNSEANCNWWKGLKIGRADLGPVPIFGQSRGVCPPRRANRARLCAAMGDFPQFMKHPANRIAPAGQATPGVEGYVFDGAGGSQMAFWNCRETAASAAHAHEFDEYMIVVEGCYTLIIEGERIPLKAGEEYFIPRGVVHGGEGLGGTRPIHAVGGQRADRSGARGR